LNANFKNMRNIAIMGCGWLGLPLATFLVEKGFRVKGSSTRIEKIPELEKRGIEAFQIKAGEKLEGQNITDFFKADTLIINIPPGSRRNPEVLQTHPKQIQAVIEAAQHGDVQQILFISSTGVYGQSDKIITEADQPNPQTASGKALVIIENWLKQQKFQLTILRFAGLVGGERKAGRFLAGKTDVPNGQAPVNLIHRDDCIRIIYEILRQEKWGEVLNACADHHPSRQEFYVRQAEKEGFLSPVFANEEGEKKGKIISNAKVKEMLDYQFLHPDPMAF
jgi:nucleoside-diphosphate-sugar epimerase